MSGKKYDLSQVSQKTKNEYLQALLNMQSDEDMCFSRVRDAWVTLHQEAEVKPKTAREILEAARDNAEEDLSVTLVDDRSNLLDAIQRALKVLP